MLFMQILKVNNKIIMADYFLILRRKLLFSNAYFVRMKRGEYKPENNR